MALTAKKVAALKQPGRYGDGHGLVLQINRGGAKSWLFRFVLHGRERWMGLGPLHTISLAQARERARRARQLLLDGVDPLEDRLVRREQAKAEAAARRTFRNVAEDFLKIHLDTYKNAKHRAQWRSTLESYAYPKLGSRQMASVDEAAINEALGPIWLKVPETASRLRQRITRIIEWDKAGRPLPMRQLRKTVRHHAALPIDDVPAFMRDLRSRDGVAARALEFLIVTAARTGEVIGAQWPEIDFDEKVWSVPAARMKAGREHRVPLSDRALEILEALPREDGNPFVFIGSSGGQGLSNMALLALLKRMGRGDITSHGFRSTFKDWATERTHHAGIVSEMALAHTVRDKVEAAYRRGDLLLKRRRLMDDWARFCGQSISNAAKVVSLRRAG